MSILLIATQETLLMCAMATGGSLLFGTVWGIVLYLVSPKGLQPHATAYQILSALTELVRALPFVVLMLLVMPFAHWLLGSGIGSKAAIVALIVAATPFWARLLEQALNQVSPRLITACQHFGGNYWQIILWVIWPCIQASLWRSLAVLMVNIISYSAMAGALGGGGLGAVAIDYGYQRFDQVMLWQASMILIFIAVSLQTICQYRAERWLKHKGEQ